MQKNLKVGIHSDVVSIADDQYTHIVMPVAVITNTFVLEYARKVYGTELSSTDLSMFKYYFKSAVEDNWESFSTVLNASIKQMLNDNQG